MFLNNSGSVRRFESGTPATLFLYNRLMNLELGCKFKLLLDHAIPPHYAHGPEEDAGMDLFSAENAWVIPGQVVKIRTGIALEMPAGVEAQVRSRSGMAANHGVVVINAPGTVDPSYRGEVIVALTKLTAGSGYEVKAGDRIAQIVFSRYLPVQLQVATELSSTTRGKGGLGSTGA